MYPFKFAFKDKMDRNCSIALAPYIMAGLDIYLKYKKRFKYPGAMCHKCFCEIEKIQ